MVTLLNITVLGLQGRLGAITASRPFTPSRWLVSVRQNVSSAGEPRGPMRRSICATSLPSPTSASPTQTLVIFGIGILLCVFVLPPAQEPGINPFTQFLRPERRAYRRVPRQARMPP